MRVQAGGVGRRSDGAGVRRLFISHSSRDRQWAEWVTAHLQASGYGVELDVRDWNAGDDFFARISDAIETCVAVVALWSQAYFEPDSYGLRELKAADTIQKRVVPLRVEDFEPPPLWRHLIYHDLFGLDVDAAVRVLLSAISGAAGDSVPLAVVSEGLPRPPGSLPPVWNVPTRSMLFTGRDELMVALRQRLSTGHRTVLYGVGGVGKSMLVVEYAHRFAGLYRLVWWVDAKEPAVIGQQLAGLAVRLGVATTDADIPNAVAALEGYLHTHEHWLVIFDSATGPAEVASVLPQGPGHVLLTARAAGWADLAAALPVQVFTRAESLSMLSAGTGMRGPQAVTLAHELGDLPLALAQAIGVMTATGMSFTEYLSALADAAGTVLAAGPPVGYPNSLAGSVQLALDHLDQIDEAGGQLARLCSVLGPERIPLWLFSDAPPGLLPEPLATIAATRFRLYQCIARIADLGLAQRGNQSLTMHRLTQSIIASQLDDQSASRALTTQLLAAARPDDVTNPTRWPHWSQLLPHILAADPGRSGNQQLRELACNALWYLVARGELAAALPLAQELHDSWLNRHGSDDIYSFFATTALSAMLAMVAGSREDAHRLSEDVHQRSRVLLGDDHPDTLRRASNLATHLRWLGRHEEAHAMDQTTVARSRRVLGDDHPDTLAAANNLAVDLRRLGRYDEAHALDKNTLSRSRRVLGNDHSHTLASANNLAVDLRRLGRHEEAYLLDEDTLSRSRQLLGHDAPTTLTSANNLADDLRRLGRLEQAHAVDKDTLSRRRRLYGDDHPQTLVSAHNLARDLRRLGRDTEAAALQEDFPSLSHHPHGDDQPIECDTDSEATEDAPWLSVDREVYSLGQDILTRPSSP